MRRVRKFHRNTVNYWTTLPKIYSVERIKQTFRVSRTFYCMLSKIEHRIRRVVESPINPDKRLAIFSWCLAREDYLYTIREMVGLAESTVCEIVVEVCAAILRIRYKKHCWTWMLNGNFHMLLLGLTEVNMKFSWTFRYDVSC